MRRMVLAVVVAVFCIACPGEQELDPDEVSAVIERAARNSERPRPKRSHFESPEEWRERMEREMAESDAAREKRIAELDEEFQEALAKQKRRRRQRRVRRFAWESPAETRGRIWNVPVEESAENLVTALLRVCIAEADGDPQDCTGIWQVVKNNRRRTCDRGMIRRITECVDGEGETYMSAIKRHQRHVLGVIKARNRRAAWIAKLTPNCEMPENYGQSLSPKLRKNPEAVLNHWDAHYGSKVCPQAVVDVKRLIAGKLPESRPGHRVKWLPGRPVTWGGRCESGKASCDDRIACARGLARIPETDTHNAFWCRPGRPGCRPTIDPICYQMGYRDMEEVQGEEQEEIGQSTPSQERDLEPAHDQPASPTDTVSAVVKAVTSPVL